MPTATAFPPIDLTEITDRPLVEVLKKDKETPEFNALLQRKRRVVSQLRNQKWPVANTPEPVDPDVEDDEEAPPPHPGVAPEQTPHPEPEAPAEPAAAPDPASDAPE